MWCSKGDGDVDGWRDRHPRDTKRARPTYARVANLLAVIHEVQFIEEDAVSLGSIM
jgi:hypothetical protein